jgi:two-component system CheB/CheR fusion protein
MGSLAVPHHIDDDNLNVTAAVGISLYPDDARSAAQLLAHGDAAMYEAKTSGPDKYTFYAGIVADDEQRRA